MNIDLQYTEPQLDIIDLIESNNHRFVVITKGRRFGLTKGMMNAFIEWSLEGQHLLWCDTISTNIDRYWERYALPELQSNKIQFTYDAKQKKANIGNGYIDFRSADRPENWEGFGYNKIFLNEAGIILRNDYLYTNAVLPMLMDFSNSVLIAGGVPKGKKKKDYKEHKFYTLYKSAKNNEPGYKLFEYTSYDNPLLNKDDIEELEQEISRMSVNMKEQEIYGKFVDNIDNTLWTPELINHIEILPELTRIVIPVDPAIKSRDDSDDTGIVPCGKDTKGNYYVLADKTGKYSPNQWAAIVINEYKTRKADVIVAEINQGGDMVKTIIHNIDRFVRIKEIHAYKGKDLRAEPVVGLYEQNRVFHIKGLHELETQMLTWIPGQGRSPNNIDAMVYGITELAGNPNTFKGHKAMKK